MRVASCMLRYCESYGRADSSCRYMVTSIALKLYLLPMGYTFLILAICLRPNPVKAMAPVAIKKSTVLGG